SSGAGRTSDGNGSHASTLKSPSYTKSVSWQHYPKKEDCNDRPNYEIQALFTAPPVPVTSEELVKAVHFYEQLKRENPPASGNQINGLTMSVKRPAN
ncbi:TPA: hypothetical protein ACTL3H_004521, partial [Escherichia coli]